MPGPDRLGDPDPAVRAAAIERVRYKDLKEPAVLRAMLRLCRDPALVPGRESKTEDPFAAFFAGNTTGAASVGEVAAARLGRTGLPTGPDVAREVALALAEDGSPGKLPRVVVRALGETRFEDLDGALEAIVPALDPHDEPLYEAIARLPEEAWPTLARLAVAPFRPRLFQELMNHAPTHDVVVAAAEAALGDGRLPPDDADVVRSLLASWSG